MYTGIVQGTEIVTRITAHNGYHSLSISNNHGFFNDVATGASVAVNGVCLTVTHFDSKNANFDLSDLTAETTTLSTVKVNNLVNIERSSRHGSENGGHSLYGHIEGVAQVKDIIPHGQTRKLVISLSQDKIKYFFNKGFIGLHGCSLTINNLDKVNGTISLNLIPETLRLTTLQYLKPGDFLNYEIEQSTRAVVDTLLNSFENLNH